MTADMIIKNLYTPHRKIDVVLDTDTYNEVDDQFALAYLVRSKEKLNPKAIYAAPFFNSKSKSPKDGMQKSFDEIFNILTLCGEDNLKSSVYKGSDTYLPDEKMPVISDAAKDLANRAKDYSPENPLYVVAIGAITNIASALLIDPSISENIVIVWLGGHSRSWNVQPGDENRIFNNEFNLRQDISAARVVMSSGAPFVQLPCRNVVDHFYITKPEIEKYLLGKNKLTDYLGKITIEHMEKQTNEPFWEKIIWDVTAISWLLNDDNRFLLGDIVKVRLPGYDGKYEKKELENPMFYVTHIYRAPLLRDILSKLLS